eukprot:783814-Prymnesium_polylepis.1
MRGKKRGSVLLVCGVRLCMTWRLPPVRACSRPALCVCARRCRSAKRAAFTFSHLNSHRASR